MSKGARLGRGVRGRIALGVAVAVAATLVLLGAPPLLKATGLTPTAASSVTPGFFDSVSEPTGNGVDVPVSPPVVATARSDAHSPDADKVVARISAVTRKDIGVTGMSFLSAEGERLYGEAEDTPLAPASNLKVLSSLAALRVLGPGTTFHTSVVSVDKDSVVLVGGGDPYLTSAESGAYPHRGSMADLAQQTADALKRQGTERVSLGYDTSLFSGPSWHPDWTDSYKVEVAPVVALTVDRSRTTQGVPRPTPVEDAVGVFVRELATRGITVTSRSEATAPNDATTIASVSSPSVEVIVEQILLHSDNDAAETLARHTAIASGLSGSFTGAAEAITAALTDLDLHGDGSVIRDASGLSKSNRVTPTMLARGVRSALHSDTYSAVVSGLPLAGVSGTLQSRYSANAGRGQVWAKTGFLSGIHGLTGILVTMDGDVVVFAMLVNGQATRGIAQPTLDSLTSAVVQCGCQS